MEPATLLLLIIFALVVAFAFILFISFIYHQSKQISTIMQSHEKLKESLENSGKYKNIHKSESQGSLTVNQNKAQIRSIVLTGGPCAGKTTALAYIAEKCSEKGIKTYIVPEAATLLCKGGFSLDNSAKQPNQVLKFQINLMKVQMSLEDIFSDIACMEKTPTLLLCDRGMMDGKAYMSKDEWQALLDETGWSTVQLRDKRYDAVLHLVTAADGAPNFYNLNNIARSETIEQAIEVDKKTRGCWMAHPGFCIIDNNMPSFKDKIDKTLECVLRQFGVPLSNLFYKKYLLLHEHSTSLIKLPDSIKHEIIDIEDYYIHVSAENVLEEKIRRRGQKDSCTYQLRTKYKEKGQTIESRKSITAREYMKYCQQSNLISGKPKITKIRQCFLWSNMYFKIDTYTNIDSNPTILIIQSGPNSLDNTLPPFIKVLREITDEKNYSVESMINPKWKMDESDILLLEGKKRLKSECISSPDEKLKNE